MCCPVYPYQALVNSSVICSYSLNGSRFAVKRTESACLKLLPFGYLICAFKISRIRRLHGELMLVPTGPFGVGRASRTIEHYSPIVPRSSKSRHLLRNAQRLLEVRIVDGVEHLALAGPQDDESLVSSASSSVIMGFEVGSAGFLERTDENDDGREGKSNDALLAVGQEIHQTGIECRVRRLEVGRKRAQEKRWAAGGLRLGKAAKVYRDMHLTCEASALASATSSFAALIQGGPGRAPATGIGREHVLALHNRVLQEFEGVRDGQRGSMHTLTDSHGGRTRTASKYSSGPPDKEDFGSLADPAQQHGRLSLDDTDEGKVESVGKTKKKPSRGGFAEGSLQKRRKQTLEGHGDGATLDQLLNAIASLAKQAEQGSMGLVEFAAWWMGAVSKAEVELKMRFLAPCSKQRE